MYVEFESIAVNLERYGKINFKKNVDTIAQMNSTSTFEFYHLLYDYKKLLNQFQFEHYITFNKIISRFVSNSLRIEKRVKSTDTIAEKIERYSKDERHNGKVSINKCLNDLMGYRLIVNYDDSLEDFKDDLDFLLKESALHHHELKPKLRITLNGNEHVYKAVHLNFWKNNFSFPWEIQFWKMKDELENKKSHSLYKQGHLNTRNYVSVIK